MYMKSTLCNKLVNQADVLGFIVYCDISIDGDIGKKNSTSGCLFNFGGVEVKKKKET